MIASGVLLIVVGLAHSYLGERYILAPVFRKVFPEARGRASFTRQVMRFAWHITTLAWWGFAAMAFTAFEPRATLVMIAAVTFLTTGLTALVASRGRHLSWILFLAVSGLLYWSGPNHGGVDDTVRRVEEAVWAFHAADTSRSAEGVLALLWPDYSMLADGHRLTYEDVAVGSRAFMASLELFHTDWSDLQILPLSDSVAVSSFVFRDSIRTRDGELIQSTGPTSLIWLRRGTEWRVIYGDADHYSL